MKKSERLAKNPRAILDHGGEKKKDGASSAVFPTALFRTLWCSLESKHASLIVVAHLLNERVASKKKKQDQKSVAGLHGQRAASRTSTEDESERDQSWLLCSPRSASHCCSPLAKISSRLSPFAPLFLFSFRGSQPPSRPVFFFLRLLYLAPAAAERSQPIHLQTDQAVPRAVSPSKPTPHKHTHERRHCLSPSRIDHFP